MNLGFWNGVGGWDPDKYITNKTDHVRLMVRLDGDSHSPPEEWGLWNVDTNAFNPQYWEQITRRIEGYRAKGLQVWLSFVPWHGDSSDEQAPTIHGLFGSEKRKARSAEAYAEFLAKNVLPDLQKFSPEELVFEPLTETAFFPSLTEDRREANEKFNAACTVLVATIRRYTPDHAIALGSYGWDQGVGPGGVYPAFTPIQDVRKGESRLIFPLHFYSPWERVGGDGSPYRWGDSKSLLDRKATALSKTSGRNEAEAMKAMSDFCPWNRTGMTMQLHTYRAWCLRWGVIPFVGEYGAFGAWMAGKEADRYNADATAAIDDLGMRKCRFYL